MVTLSTASVIGQNSNQSGGCPCAADWTARSGRYDFFVARHGQRL